VRIISWSATSGDEIAENDRLPQPLKDETGQRGDREDEREIRQEAV
jgi:hypothetical protein